MGACVVNELGRRNGIMSSTSWKREIANELCSHGFFHHGYTHHVMLPAQTDADVVAIMDDDSCMLAPFSFENYFEMDSKNQYRPVVHGITSKHTSHAFAAGSTRVFGQHVADFMADFPVLLWREHLVDFQEFLIGLFLRESGAVFSCDNTKSSPGDFVLADGNCVAQAYAVVFGKNRNDDDPRPHDPPSSEFSDQPPSSDKDFTVDEQRLRLLGRAYEWFHSSTGVYGDATDGRAPSLCEFNLLLHFAYHSDKWRERYAWRIAPGHTPIISRGLHGNKIPKVEGCPSLVGVFGGPILKLFPQGWGPAVAPERFADGYVGAALGTSADRSGSALVAAPTRSRTDAANGAVVTRLGGAGKNVKKRETNEGILLPAGSYPVSGDEFGQRFSYEDLVTLLTGQAADLPRSQRDAASPSARRLALLAALARDAYLQHLFLFPNALNYLWTGKSFSFSDISWFGVPLRTTAEMEVYLRRFLQPAFQLKTYSVEAPMGWLKDLAEYYVERRRTKSVLAEAAWEEKLVTEKNFSANATDFRRELAEYFEKSFRSLRRTPYHQFGGDEIVRAWNSCFYGEVVGRRY